MLAIASYDWRWTYGGVALYLGLIVIPIFLLLLKDLGHRPPADSAPVGPAAQKQSRPQKSWTRAEVLRDPRVYLLLPGLLAVPIISTAMFFHHLTLAGAKGWSHAWITGSYLIFAGYSAMGTCLMIAAFRSKIE